MRSTTARERLRDDIDACGYFPDFIEDSVLLALGDEEVVAHLVHVEATFQRDEVHRHLTVLVLTPSRLLINHTDETDEVAGTPAGAASTTESIRLPHLNAVALTRVVTKPERFGRGAAVVETWLQVGWGTVSRVDLEPASCSDPTCEADHGYSGEITSDDLIVRVSAAADGAERVEQLIGFASALQRATGR